MSAETAATSTKIKIVFLICGYFKFKFCLVPNKVKHYQVIQRNGWKDWKIFSRISEGEPGKITTNILYMQESERDKTDFFANALREGYF